MSGRICAPTSCATSSGTATPPSSRPANQHGTSSPAIQSAFDPSDSETGHVSVFKLAGIRREHWVKGKSIKEIARDLKMSRNTVRKVLRSGETSFSYEREVQPRPKLGRWREELDRLLTKNAGATARERLTLIRLFEELRSLGYEGGYDTV